MLENYFHGSTIEDNEPDHHVIVTDHPYMNEIGLGVFTTGVLYKWWYEQDHRGEYKNRKIFGFTKTEENPDFDKDKQEEEGDSDDNPEYIEVSSSYNDSAPTKLLLGDPRPTDKDWGSFLAWRKETILNSDVKSGRYHRKSILSDSDNPWDYKQEKASYSFSDLGIDSYNDIKYHSYQPEHTVSGPVNDVGEVETEHVPETHNTSPMPGISPITNIIAMNDYMRYYEVKSEKEKKDWPTQEKAIDEFLTDIKASKYGFVEFSGEIPFNINLADGSFQCQKTDWVTYKLYLYDDQAPRQTARAAALSSMKFVAPPRDSIGRVEGSREDGESTAFDTEDPSAEIAADLDVTYNEYDGKWESGSKQVVAIITQEIPPAVFQPSAHALKEAEVKDVLDPQAGKHIFFGSGLAMPITMQNGNPAQWSPNYAGTKGCRDDQKAIVKAFNPDPNISFSVDTKVLLNKIDGLWIAMKFGSGLQPPPPAIFDGRWEFSYHATNADFFYRDISGERVEPRQVEKAFHNAYYYGSDNHETWSKEPPLDLGDGFHQFTSFDFMDKYVGGTRGEKRSLATTQFSIDPLDEEIGGERGGQGAGKYMEGTTSGPFFGCVFPDGYSDPAVADYMKEEGRAYHVVGKQNQTYQYFNKGSSDGNTGGADIAISKTDLPFTDGDDDSRNDCKNTAMGYRYTVAGEEKWSVGEPDGDSSLEAIPMFVRAEQGSFSLKSLPADIGTHCSPKGTHGRPIPNLHFLGQFYKEAHLGENLRSVVAAYFKDDNRYSWLYKSFWVDGEEKFGPDESAFDFEPTTKNVLQFRPLKAEVYAMFDLMNNGTLAFKYSQADRSAFGGAAWEQMKSYAPNSNNNDDRCPASRTSWSREKNANGGNPLYNSEADGDKRLWDVGGTLNALVSNGLKITQGDINRDFTSNYGARVSHTVWDEPWMHNRLASQGSTGGGSPPGAVGVIGAIATGGSNGSFIFNTSNYIGSKHDFMTSQRHAVWGGPDRAYDTFRTTDLSVTIYQAWPREQTIYDPRFFAVHHFNPDLALSAELREGPAPHTWVQLGEVKYNIEQSESTVDLRWPTIKPTTNPVDFSDDVDGTDMRYPLGGEIAKVGNVVFGNGAMPFLSAANAQDGIWGTESDDALNEWLPESMWQIDIRRRGKLLPYSYFLSTVGVKEENVVYKSFQDPHSLYTHIPSIPTEGVSGYRVDMVVTNPGQGYIIGDKLTVAGHKNVEIEVTVTGYSPSDITPGAVLAFKVNNQGTGIPVQNFFNHDSLLKPATTGPLKVTHTDDTKGTGFDAYFVQGKVHNSSYGVDNKPEIATESEFYRLSAKPNDQPDSMDSSTVTNVHAWTNDVTQGTETVTAYINRPSPDRKYDMFFHFQNDISHTLLDPKWGLPYINTLEQFVELNIGAGGGSSAGVGVEGSHSAYGVGGQLSATLQSALPVDAPNNPNPFVPNFGSVNDWLDFGGGIGGYAAVGSPL